MIFENIILGIYKKILLKRYDPDATAIGFKYTDFDGLCVKEYSFLGDKAQRLSAYLYSRGEIRRDRLIMFEHGMGNGHTSYLREINLLTEHGYTVFTYDHTGTRSSEGEHIGGFSQSLADFDKAYEFVRSLPEFKDSKISVIGHSWGGFSTMNASSLHPEITHAVAISGFASPRYIQEQYLKGPLALYRKAAFGLELESFPKYARADGCVTLAATNTKTLVIHSRDDDTCGFDKNFPRLQAAARNNANVEFLALDGKNHNPNYTLDAIAYKGEYYKALKDKRKRGELDTDEQKKEFAKSFDLWRMTAQDGDVWNKILNFLEK